MESVIDLTFLTRVIQERYNNGVFNNQMFCLTNIRLLFGAGVAWNKEIFPLRRRQATGLGDPAPIHLRISPN